MSDWNKNNSAHFFTWADLITFYELPEKLKFSESATFKTSDLLFYADTASGGSRQKRAKALSSRLDTAFRLLHGAKMETGMKKADAIDAMTSVLIDADKTVADLAYVADDHYLFHTEAK